MSDNSFKQVGVWIDHSKAHLVGYKRMEKLNSSRLLNLLMKVSKGQKVKSTI
jgi:hypothetical protein